MALAQLRTDYLQAVMRVSGVAPGTVVYNEGLFSDLTRESVGTFLIDIDPGADELQSEISVKFLSAYDAAFTYAVEWVSDQQIRVRTFANGALYDADFCVEMNVVRTVTQAEADATNIPAPAPAPSTTDSSFADITAVAPGAGVNTTTTSLQLKDAAGNNLALSAIVEFAVFDDATLGIPAVNATLNNATAGTIIAGTGTNALLIQTNAAGLFTCDVTDAVDETVFLAASLTFGSPLLDLRDTASVEFTA